MGFKLAPVVSSLSVFMEFDTIVALSFCSIWLEVEMEFDQVAWLSLLISCLLSLLTCLDSAALNLGKRPTQDRSISKHKFLLYAFHVKTECIRLFCFLCSLLCVQFFSPLLMHSHSAGLRDCTCC